MIKENLAYDIKRYEQAGIEEQVQLKVIKSTKRNKKINRLPAVSLFVIVIMLLVAIVFTKISLTEISSEIATAQTQLNSLSSESVRLEMDMESDVSKKNIDEKAGMLLGINKEDPSQVTYVSLGRENKAVVSKESNGILGHIKTSFDAGVEYIRNLLNNN